MQGHGGCCPFPGVGLGQGCLTVAAQPPGAGALGPAGGNRVVQARNRCGLWLWHPPPLPVECGWVLVTKAEPMRAVGCEGHRLGAGVVFPRGHGTLGWVVNVTEGHL